MNTNTPYSKEQVQHMEPGRELDWLVAKHVTEYERVGSAIYDEEYICPAFSTDIAAAFQIVERLQAKIGMTSTVFEMRYMDCGSMMTSNAGILYNSMDMQWTAAFGFDAAVKAATAPLVICRAALIHNLGL